MHRCPNCNMKLGLEITSKLIFNDVIECPRCRYMMQPSVKSGLLFPLLLTPIVYFFFYKSFNNYFGEFSASALVIMLTIFLCRFLNPWASLVAHDKDELI